MQSGVAGGFRAAGERDRDGDLDGDRPRHRRPPLELPGETGKGAEAGGDAPARRGGIGGSRVPRGVRHAWHVDLGRRGREREIGPGGKGGISWPRGPVKRGAGKDGNVF